MDRLFEHLAASDDEFLLDDPDLLLGEEETSTDIAWENAPAAPLPLALAVARPGR
ncbi:MAG: hypothetical protein ACREFQ_23125 [Stellaceae bacterium]